jgi:hypothetical protein
MVPSYTLQTTWALQEQDGHTEAASGFFLLTVAMHYRTTFFYFTAIFLLLN